MMPKYLFHFMLVSLTSINCTIAQETAISTHSKKFTLITSLYNETHDVRIKEYITCFEKNRAHEDIENFIVFYDTSKDHLGKLTILNYLKSIEIPIIYISGRPTFQDCFNAASEYCLDGRVIICNADIFFNKTLELLREYDLTDKFLALTRWDIQRDGKIVPSPFDGRNRNDRSQDAWIFQTPIREIPSENIPLGTFWCDSKIARRAQQSGLKVINPCFSIQCLHLHLSGVRHAGQKPHTYIALHGRKPIEDVETMKVPWITLE